MLSTGKVYGPRCWLSLYTIVIVVDGIISISSIVISVPSVLVRVVRLLIRCIGIKSILRVLRIVVIAPILTSVWILICHYEGVI